MCVRFLLISIRFSKFIDIVSIYQCPILLSDCIIFHCVDILFTQRSYRAVNSNIVHKSHGWTLGCFPSLAFMYNVTISSPIQIFVEQLLGISLGELLHHCSVHL